MSNYIKLDGIIYLPEEIKDDINKSEELHNCITSKIVKLIKNNKCETIVFSRIINDKGRELSPYSIYKHFKGKYYATIDKSTPIPNEKFKKLVDLFVDSNKDNSTKSLTVQHTETEEVFNIYCVDGNWYHNSLFDTKELCIYKSLYDNEMTYARPLDMFLSPVDKDKYPYITQEYRFEKQ